MGLVITLDDRPEDIDPPERQLRDAMASYDIQCDSVIMDGKIHRFGEDEVNWYIAFGDNIPAGTFGCWSTGVRENWVANVGRDVTPEEQDAILARIEQAKRERARQEQAKQAHAARVASEVWGESTDAEEHEYLERKGVKANGAKVSPDSRLVLPMYSPDGEICSLQFIAPDGSKRFLAGGRVSGCFGFAGDISGAKLVYVAEGFATAATVHEATGSPVFWSYSAHNLPAVAEYVSSLGVPMTIIADHDLPNHHAPEGTGQKYAAKAAELTGAIVITPPEPGDVNDYAQAGGNLTTLLGIQSGEWLVHIDDLLAQPQPLRWLVKRWLPRASTAMVFGPSGGGKTFFVLSLIMHVAAGRDWGGRKVRQASVAYLAGEGYQGIASRLMAIRQRDPTLAGNVWVSRSGVQLDTPNGFNKARAAIAELPEVPGVIVIDTLHRFLSGDENSAQDAGKMIHACDRLRDEFNATILLVHHTGKATTETSRGSGAWRGAMDVEILLQPGIEIVQTKMKDTEALPIHYGELISTPIPWVDEDGDQVKSAVFSFTSEKPLDPFEVAALNDSKARFKRAWYASKCEELQGAPYVSTRALECYLVQNERLPEAKMKLETNPSKGGLIGRMFAADVLQRGGDGWVITDPGLAEAMIEERGRG